MYLGRVLTFLGWSARAHALLALVLLAATGCDSLFGGSGASELVGTDGGAACVKDREVLSGLLAQPRACAATSQCPTGAFCDTVAGRCDWDCFADSDCGTGHTCSCEGQCVGAGAVVDAGPGSDPSCARDLAVLADIDERSCLRDEHCALGSRCDELTRRCTYDCTSNTECAAGSVCDCRGACVTAGAADPVPPNSKPESSVTPTYIVVQPGSTWGKQTFSVRIETAALPAGTVPRARLEVLNVDGPGLIGLAASEQAGEKVTSIGDIYFSTAEELRARTRLASATQAQIQDDLQVTAQTAAAIIARRPLSNLADLVDAGLVTGPSLQRLKSRSEVTGATCTATSGTRILAGSDWVVDTGVTGYAATASASVSRCASAPDTAVRKVAISTYLVKASEPDTVVRHLDYQTIELGTQGAPGDGATTATGMYEGSLVIADRVSGEIQTIPVHAWATRSDALLIFDDLSLLSASGRLVLQSTPTFLVALAPTGGSSGKLTARVSGWVDEGGRNGQRLGRFTVTFPNAARPLEVGYALRRTGSPSHPLSGATTPLATAAACTTSGTTCGTTATCVPALSDAGAPATAGRCAPGTGPTATSLTNNLAHVNAEQWRNGSEFLETISHRFENFNDLFDYADTEVLNDDRDRPALLGERLLCYAYNHEVSNWGLTTADESHPLGYAHLVRMDWQANPALTTTADPLQGDLQCGVQLTRVSTPMNMSYAGLFTQTAVPLVAGARAEISRTTFPQNTAPDRTVFTSHPTTTTQVSASQRLQACLTDLARAVPPIITDDRPPLEWPVGVARAYTKTWFGTAGKCINLAQVIPALNSFSRGTITSSVPDHIDLRAGGMFQRLLAQWLDVHAFIAQQGVQEKEASASLDNDTTTPVSGAYAPDLVALMDTVERGWDLVLDRKNAEAIAALTAPNVRDPDVRAVRPTAYYSFEPATVSGRHVLDIAGNYHLDLLDTAAAANGVLRKTGSAIAWGALMMPPKAPVPVADATLSFWVDTSTLPVTTGTGAAAPFAVFSDPNAFRVELHRDTATSGFRVGFVQTGTSGKTVTVPVGGWKHIVVVRSARRVSAYVDGLIKNWDAPASGDFLSVYPGNARPTSQLHLFMGGFSAAGGGVTIDEVSLWEHAFGPGEVSVVRDRTRTPTQAQRLAPPHPLFDPALAPWGGSQPNHEQGLGLATKLLDTASNHADLITAFATQSLASVYGSCYVGGTSQAQRDALARAGRGMRYLTAVEALAADLEARASTVACTGNLECTTAGAATCSTTQSVCLDAAGAVFETPPSWEESYREALTRFAAARARAVNELKRIDRCENPLGIPETDLPLYFGDVTGDNSRFFASSDYLMNTWAKPTVTLAQNALTDARTAWQSMRQSNIQQLMNDYDAERRMEGLMQSYVRPIIDACGLSGYSPSDVLPAFARGELTPTNCFRAPRCSGDSRGCLRGQMGDAALAMKSAVTALRTEEHQQDRRHEEWDVQTDVCERVTRSIQGDLQAIADYKEAAKKARRKSKGIWGSVAGWLDDKFETDFFENAFDYISGCLSGGQSGAQTGAAAGPPGAVVGAIVGCGSSLNSTYAKKGIEDLELAKEELQHTLTQSALLREMDACWDEVGQRARDVEYGLDFTKQQLVNLEQAGQRIDEMMRTTDRNVDEASAVLSRESGRTLPSVAHHFWTDEKIARYRYQLERSRRMTFLAMRAVEYELQQSLGLRSAILSATHPDELETIVDTLDAERAARTLNGRRPAAGTEVLSLRNDILGLRDLTPPHAGERADSSTQRLRQILTSPDYAMYDDNGKYLGQGVPFKLSESGALRHRCAERVWRVTATIQGDLTNVEDPGTHVFLLKNNVFQSQWCAGQSDGSDYQQASTNHTTNLFRGDEAPSEEDRSEYTTAVLYPWFNVRRGEFYRDAYTEGSSEELAGRGLYGEYVLLFPYHGMLEPDADCNPRTDASCAHPFRDLEQVEDVLIRFDYTSIDNLEH